MANSTLNFKSALLVILGLNFLVASAQAECTGDGCIQDLLQEVKFAKKVYNIMLEGAADFNFNSLKDEIAFKEKLRITYHSLDLCTAAFDRYCATAGKNIDQVLAKKVRFDTDPNGKILFPWTSQNKKTYLNALKRKVCSDSISLSEIQELDGIYFFNTQCFSNSVKSTSDELVMGIPDTDHCASGYNGTASRFWSKDRHIILFNGDLLNTYFQSKTQSIGLMDDTLLHEFIHHRRDVDPSFKAKTDQFLSLAFENKKKKYEGDYAAFAKEITEYPQIILKDKTLTDEQKNEKMRAHLKQVVDQFSASLTYIPKRYGPYSTNTIMILEGRTLPAYSPNYPTISKGKIIGSTSWSGESYSLSAPEEYVAVSLALYRYDRENAEKFFTREELQWLRKNWNMAYSITERKI